MHSIFCTSHTTIVNMFLYVTLNKEKFCSVSLSLVDGTEKASKINFVFRWTVHTHTE